MPQRRSLTGAWIETQEMQYEDVEAIVAPSRERGLKPDGRTNEAGQLASLPHGSVD